MKSTSSWLQNIRRRVQKGDELVVKQHIEDSSSIGVIELSNWEGGGGNQICHFDLSIVIYRGRHQRTERPFTYMMPFYQIIDSTWGSWRGKGPLKWWIKKTSIILSSAWTGGSLQPLPQKATPQGKEQKMDSRCTYHACCCSLTGSQDTGDHAFIRTSRQFPTRVIIKNVRNLDRRYTIHALSFCWQCTQ